MTTDERLDALAVTVENLAGLMKDSIERQDRHDEQITTLTEDVRLLTGVVVEMREQAEADRQQVLMIAERMDRMAEETRVGFAVLTASVETLVKVGAQHDERLTSLTAAVEKVLDVQFQQRNDIDRITAAQAKTGADIDALVSVQLRHDEQIQVVKATTTAILALAERLTVGQEEMIHQADHDRRAMREIVGDLKDSIHQARDRADGAHKRIDKLESDAA